MSTRSIAAAAAVVSLSLSAATLPGYVLAAGAELTEVVVTATRTRTPLAELAVHEPDYKLLIAFLKGMEFNTLTRRVAEFAHINQYQHTLAGGRFQHLDTSRQ